MPYEVYKLIHLGSIFFVIAYAALYFHSDEVAKPVKILTGILSFVIFVGGMGLIARLDYDHGAPWPTWIKVKIALWLVIAVGIPVLGKRLSKELKPKAFYGIMVVFLLAAYTAIYKPF